MKIKTKKQLNLPQLIEWAWDNGIKNERFIHSDSNPPEYVWINENSNVELDEDMCISKTDAFTVEVEEEITEDTVIPKLVSIGRENENEIDIRYDCKVGQFLDNEDFNYYVLNDDDTLTLIWRDGKLVE